MSIDIRDIIRSALDSAEDEILDRLDTYIDHVVDDEAETLYEERLDLIIDSIIEGIRESDGLPPREVYFSIISSLLEIDDRFEKFYQRSDELITQGGMK